MKILHAIRKPTVLLSFASLVTSCAVLAPTPQDQIVKLSSSGNCTSAESLARQKLQGGDMYLALSVVEFNCRKDLNKGLEYLRISASLGNQGAVETLKENGYQVPNVSKPLVPPVSVSPRPVMEPAPVQQQTSPADRCVILNNNLVQCGNRQCFLLQGGNIQCQ